MAPFDTDASKIAATAFDRESGQPVPANALQIYRDAVAQYHLHPESKFLGGNYCDRGTTRRRHIRASGIRHIGKEANELERQQMLGTDGEFDPDYGFADESFVLLRSELASLVSILGKSGAAEALRMPPGRLSALLRGTNNRDFAMAHTLASRVPIAMQLCQKLSKERRQELQRLRESVQLNGLREAARQLSIDPSNLRRRLLKA